MFKRVLVVGGSRGLGRSIVAFLSLHLKGLEELWVVSRKLPDPWKVPFPFKLNWIGLDMSKAEAQESLAELISKSNLDLIIYTVGGGPFGEFAKKEWKDHFWALQVGLIAPMVLVWSWLKTRGKGVPGRFIIVGSRIAEFKPDTKAASYAASKHGLKGFVSSIQDELKFNENKVWLFSPGYMDTELLPKSAMVRHNGSKIISADKAAVALLRWIKKEGPWHRVIG